MGIYQIKTFCMAKENIRKMKREPVVWENIFASDISDKGLISKICKEFTGLQSRKTNIQFKKMGKGLELPSVLQGRHTRGPRDI